ncbi:hypothetical protein [Crinalium epipsammum]|nr:hypothetical protein [Crinalium epipsammum]
MSTTKPVNVLVFAGIEQVVSSRNAFAVKVYSYLPQLGRSRWFGRA